MQGCQPKKVNPLITKIEKTFSSGSYSKNKKDPVTTNMHTIVLYDLVDQDSSDESYMFATHYSSLLNNDSYLMDYASKLKSKTFELKKIKSKAKNKLGKFIKIVEDFNKKYKIPNVPLFLKIKMSVNSENILEHLTEMDRHYSYLPILVPEEDGKVNSNFGNRCFYRNVKVPITTVRKFRSKGKGKIKQQFRSVRTSSCRMHYGIDLKSQKENIYAAGSGTVIEIRNDRDFGNNIIIDHGHGIKTRYAHLRSMNVRKDAIVFRGQKIGVQGNTGRSTGPHLHYETIINGHRINPINFVDFHKVYSAK